MAKDEPQYPRLEGLCPLCGRHGRVILSDDPEDYFEFASLFKGVSLMFQRYSASYGSTKALDQERSILVVEGIQKLPLPERSPGDKAIEKLESQRNEPVPREYYCHTIEAAGN